MKSKYIVEVELNKHTIFVPVEAIDEDDARCETVHILYWMINTDVELDVINVKTA